MSYFLDAETSRRVREMARLRNTTHLTSTGSKTTRRAFLNGVNDARLVGCSGKLSAHGMPYIVLEMDRDPVYLDGKREVFATLRTNLFYPSDFGLILQLGEAFGHNFVDKPPDYANRAYVGALLRRINTWVGRELKVAVIAYNDSAGDGWGGVEQRVNGYGYTETVEVTRTDVVGFYSINDTPTLNWAIWLKYFPEMSALLSDSRQAPTTNFAQSSDEDEE